MSGVRINAPTGWSGVLPAPAGAPPGGARERRIRFRWLVPTKIEGVRVKAERLVARGRPAEGRPGLFTLRCPAE
ncbi:hypothetical protein [Streptomyces sp. NTH33]|uniref:hypothetical protein n=1 Tax=Streptomyces sp. NTH33 TaxID=1735453 RepID=UPI0011B94701|nr:hypothetical protein [Streptomyces sp. NTH33]